MRESFSHHRRLSRTLPNVAAAGSVAVVLLGLFFWARSAFSPLPFRQTVVVVGNPVHVLSFDTKNRKVTAVDIAQDTVVPAALGYGSYTVRALISLDALDHRGGVLLRSSISNALGLPVSGYVAPAGGSADGEMSVSLLRRIFSLGSVIDAILGRLPYSVSLADWIRMVIAARSVSADAVKTVGVGSAVIRTSAADGSPVSAFDDSKLEYLLGDLFFDGGLRNEGVSVAVYNVTAVPSIGLRAARQLSRSGLKLVFVGNAEGESSRCTVTGSGESLRSNTAKFIRYYFGCDQRQGIEIGKETGADLVVLLGTAFADQYK